MGKYFLPDGIFAPEYIAQFPGRRSTSYKPSMAEDCLCVNRVGIFQEAFLTLLRHILNKQIVNKAYFSTNHVFHSTVHLDKTFSFFFNLIASFQTFARYVP